MRIAVLGDSFVACLKEAVDDDPLLSKNHDLAFFAGPSQSLKDLVVENNCLVADSKLLGKYLSVTSGYDFKSLNPKDFDAFLMVGLGIDIRPLFRHYSQAVLRASIKGLIESSVCLETVKKINKLTDKQVFSIPAPVKALTQDRFNKIYGHPVYSYSYLMSLVSSFLNDYGVCFFEQPKETRDHEWITNNEFSQGSTRLIQGTPHPEEDIAHMNQAYGKLVLRHFFSSIN